MVFRKKAFTTLSLICKFQLPDTEIGILTQITRFSIVNKITEIGILKHCSHTSILPDTGPKNEDLDTNHIVELPDTNYRIGILIQKRSILIQITEITSLRQIT